eukprot:802039_1
MARFLTVLILTLLAATSTTVVAFTPPSINTRTSTRVAATANEDTDFDAPVLKNPQMASVLDHEPLIVDDECYLGKYGQHSECVDFDPIHESKAKQEINAEAASEMPSFTRLGVEISYHFKNSRLGKLFG